MPVKGGSTNGLPIAAYNRYRNQAGQLRNLLNNLPLGTPTHPGRIALFEQHLTVQRQSLVDTKARPGIDRVAREEEEDPSYDLTVEHAALLVAIDAVLAEITALGIVKLTVVETADLRTAITAAKSEIV